MSGAELVVTTPQAVDLVDRIVKPGSMKTWEPDSIGEAMGLAQLLANSNIIPTALRGAPGNVLAVMMFGRELGLSTMQSLLNVWFEPRSGRPAMYAQTLVGLVKKSRLCEWFTCEHSDDLAAIYATQRRGAPAVARMKFTIEQARAAKLLDKDVWKSHPAAMLRARASMNLARMVYEEIAAGIYDPEELEDAYREPVMTAPPPPSAPPVTAPRTAPPPPAAAAPPEPRRADGPSARGQATLERAKGPDAAAGRVPAAGADPGPQRTQAPPPPTGPAPRGRRADWTADADTFISHPATEAEKVARGDDRPPPADAGFDREIAEAEAQVAAAAAAKQASAAEQVAAAADRWIPDVNEEEALAGQFVYRINDASTSAQMEAIRAEIKAAETAGKLGAKSMATIKPLWQGVAKEIAAKEKAGAKAP